MSVSAASSERVAIVGAGPIGIELHVALRRLGVDVLHLEAGQIGQTISWYPREVRFFSSPERIAIAGVPLVTTHQEKATREEYLAYLRSVVGQYQLPINSYEKLVNVTRKNGFVLETETSHGMREYHVSKVVLAFGDMHRPRNLEIPGEDLPHVSHYFDEAHPYFRRRVLIVGGKNSAVEAALRCHRVGADVTVSYRQLDFRERSVKAWILPDIRNQIKAGGIAFHPGTVPTEITPQHVVLETVADGTTTTVESDFVLLLTGYTQDPTLFHTIGVDIDGENEAPVVDEATLESDVPGVFVAGTAVAGTQKLAKLFIENCHPHVDKIARAITGRPAPFSTDDTSRVARNLPES